MPQSQHASKSLIGISHLYVGAEFLDLHLPSLILKHDTRSLSDSVADLVDCQPYEQTR